VENGHKKVLETVMENHFQCSVQYTPVKNAVAVQHSLSCVQDSGAHIKVFVQCCPHSTERVIQVSGQMEKVITCVGLIIEDLVEVCSLPASYSVHNVLYDMHLWSLFAIVSTSAVDGWERRVFKMT